MTLHDLKCLGFFGEVFRGIWNGTDVAIKVFLEQDLTPENMENFCNEVSILRYSPPCLCHDQIRTSVVLTSSLFFLWFNISRIRHPNGTWRLTHLYFLYHPLKTSYPSSLHGSHSLPVCMKPPKLSMVTEYMEMGALYYLIHTTGQKNLSWRRRLRMLRDICR